MRMYDLIEKKKNKQSLTKDEIAYIVSGFTKGELPDYQMAAFLMAVYFQDMTMEETVNLTLAMAQSGDVLDLSAISGVKVDKHSTGGVGDKTSLVIGPILAALGIPVAKMSGRGLGHTGGTIDKLESFTGFSTTMPEEQFIKQVNDIKFALVGQTANLAPADKKIYALRDVTATVNHKSLIASSVMSKKIASGADVIVLDVKTGSGAFMQTEEEAIELAKIMVSIGTMAGRTTIALITDMNEPLGHNVGNALEVKEVIDVLNGNGEQRLTELSFTLAAYMIYGAGYADSVEDARKRVEEVVANGQALQKLAQFVVAQGGDAEEVFHPEKLKEASLQEDVYVKEDGYLAKCVTSEVGMASLVLGGGRETKESVIDLSVGIKLHHKLGDYITKEEPLATIYANRKESLEMAKQRLVQAYSVSPERPDESRLIKAVITKENLEF